MAKNKDYAYQAFRLLKFAFVVAPLIAGIDKFFNMLTTWSMYLSPLTMRMIGFHNQPFLMIVGIVEIIAGLGVMLKPKFFAPIVALWLFLIIINLLCKGMYFDIALRDFGLFLAALALTKLSKKYG